MIKPRMTTQEINALLKKYWKPSGYTFPDFEHRFEQESSAMVYALLRGYKPTNIVALGTSFGGSTCLMMHAIIKNKKPFKYLAAEIEDNLREETRKHCVKVNKRVPELIGDLTKYEDYPDDIDFLFHDTNHDRETTEWVFKNIMPKVKKGALVVFHDWPVAEQEDGRWIAKDQAWPETQYMLELKKDNKLPLEKVYFNWELGTGLETGVFLKK